MAIRPVLIDKQSPSLGENCALCKEPFAPGEEIIICPHDATPHHVRCWRANDDGCAAYGCSGRGEPIARTSPAEEAVEEDDVIEPEVVDQADSKVRTLPSGNFSCAQSCLLLAIAFSIVVVAISCFGLWAIVDFFVMDVMGWHYRDPLSQLTPVLAGPLLMLIRPGPNRRSLIAKHGIFNTDTGHGQPVDV